MSTRLAAEPRSSSASYCAPCAWGGYHVGCIGEGLSTGRHAPCECAEQGHVPDDRVASAMRLYCRPDLAGDTAEHLADEYLKGKR